MSLNLAKFFGRNFSFMPPQENEFETAIRFAWAAEPRKLAEAELHAIRWISDAARRAGASVTRTLEVQGKASEMLWSCAARRHSPFAVNAELRELMAEYDLVP